MNKQRKKGDFSFRSLAGMNDILPTDSHSWLFFERQLHAYASTYGFSRIDTPILEEARLFSKIIGKHTDIIEKELYRINENEDNEIALRPEFTSGIVRAYLQHGNLYSQIHPLRLYSMGPVFRRDHDQMGRFRQFHQYNFEIFGDGHAIADAQLIIMIYKFLVEFGLPVTVRINSIGTLESREVYIGKLREYLRYKKRDMCESCKTRVEKNPLLVFDCKEDVCREILSEAPQIIDWIDDGSRSHFIQVLEFLDELDIPYILDARLVRGMDYYTRTVFEMLCVDDGDTNSWVLGGGGRYDELLPQLGKQNVSTIGFAGGIERLLLKLKERGIETPRPRKHIFLAQLGQEARKRALKIFESLRRHGIVTATSFSDDGLSRQMERAVELGVPFAIIIGQKEILDKTVIIRDMENGIQETVDLEKLIHEIKKRLEKNGIILVEPAHPERTVEIDSLTHPNQIRMF